MLSRMETLHAPMIPIRKTTTTPLMGWSIKRDSMASV
jgi:hypothetical protein